MVANGTFAGKGTPAESHRSPDQVKGNKRIEASETKRKIEKQQKKEKSHGMAVSPAARGGAGWVACLLACLPVLLASRFSALLNLILPAASPFPLRPV